MSKSLKFIYYFLILSFIILFVVATFVFHKYIYSVSSLMGLCGVGVNYYFSKKRKGWVYDESY